MSLLIRFYLRDFRVRDGRPMGGVATAVHGLAAALADAGVAVSVLHETDPGDSPIGSTFGYEVHGFEKSGGRFTVPPTLRRHLESEPPSLIVLNGLFQPSVSAVARVLARRRVRYVFAPHGVYARDLFAKNPHVKWPYWWLFESRVLKNAAAVQLLESSQVEDLHRLGIHRPTFEVPNGFSGEGPDPESLEWRDEGPVRLLFFGRIDRHHKGLDLLIRAVARLRAQSDVELTIQGPDFGSRPELERLAARERVEENVRFVDANYAVPAPAIIAGHDVLCMPSRYEGFGLSALEAMLAARVVLVTESAGVASHVARSGCGELTKPTVDSVTEGLRRLIDRRAEWRSMGLAGQLYAGERLTWSRVAAVAMARYEDVL